MYHTLSVEIAVAAMSPTQHEAEQVMLQTPAVDALRHWSKLYSAEAHLAGDKAHAERIRDLWRSYGIRSELARYDVLQNFPISTALELRSGDGAVLFKASLEEDELPDDPTSLRSKGLPAFHGFAKNGDVEAPLVYANFGTPEDFESLKNRGVDVLGKIVICKYANVFRGLKVRTAQQAGAVGVIMYNDPQEDGEYTAKNGYKHYPDGPAHHPSSIQRGSVDFFSVAVGDPSTPGYPSLAAGSLSCDSQDSLASHFVRGCGDFDDDSERTGLTPQQMSKDTKGWLGEIEGVEYCTGPSKEKVFLSSQGDSMLQQQATMRALTTNR